MIILISIQKASLEESFVFQPVAHLNPGPKTHALLALVCGHSLKLNVTFSNIMLGLKKAFPLHIQCQIIHRPGAM